MKPANDILKELEQIAPLLASADKVNFYEVEKGYFENNTGHLVALAMKPSIFESIKKQELYAAPAPVYFESFSDQLFTKIHAEEVSEELSFTAPVLKKIAKQEPYAVPASYFNALPEIITQLAAHETAAHERDMEQIGNKWTAVLERTWTFMTRPTYAFAMASFVGMIICLSLLINDNSLSDEDAIVAQMQQIPASDLHHYLGKHRDEFDERTILHNINNIDLSHYFDKPEDAPALLKEPAQNGQNEDVNADQLID